MGLVELPQYTPKQVEQYATNQRVRPDISAKASMKNAQQGVWSTAIGGTMNLLAALKKKADDAKKQRQGVETEKAKLSYVSKIHDLGQQLSTNPLNSSSVEVADFTDAEKGMPNYSYMSRELKTFGDELLGGITDKDVRNSVELFIQEKNITAGDATFKWDADIAKGEAMREASNVVQAYQDQRDVTGAEQAIDYFLDIGTIQSKEDAAKYKDSVRMGVTVANLGDIARKMEPQMGLALLEKTENMKFVNSTGVPVDIPEKIQSELVSQYRKDMTDRDNRIETGYLDIGMKAQTVADCDKAIASLANESFFDADSKNKTMEWLERKRSRLLQDDLLKDKNMDNAEATRLKANEDLLGLHVQNLIRLNDYPGAASIIKDAVGNGRVSQAFATKQLQLVQSGDDPGFRDMISKANSAIKDMKEDVQAGIISQLSDWYYSLSVAPTQEQRERAIYDARKDSLKDAASSYYSLRVQSEEIGKGVAEISFEQQKKLLEGSAGYARKVMETEYPYADYGINFSASNCSCVPDDSDMMGLGRGFPIARDGSNGNRYALIPEGRKLVLKRFEIGASGKGQWVVVEKKPKPKPAPKPKEPEKEPLTPREAGKLGDSIITPEPQASDGGMR